MTSRVVRPVARAGATIVLLALAAPVLAQEAGWHYSPLPGEGDRAALGCNRNARPDAFTCIALRCEDDYTVGVHIHTSRPGGDAGEWQMTFDREFATAVRAEASDAPYGARIDGDVADVLEALRTSGIVYLDPADGADIERQIPLTGSLNAINRALFFCAPRNVPSGDHVPAVDGKDGAGDETGEGGAEK